MDVHRVRIAGALAALADLHDELPVLRELQDHVVGAAARRRLGPPAVAADPDESFRIDRDAVLTLGPVESRTVAAPAAQQLSRRVEFEDGRRGVRALVGWNRSRTVEDPDVIARIDSNRRHLAEHPVVRYRRPLRVELERRCFGRAGLLSAGGRCEPGCDTEDHHGRSEHGDGSASLREHVRLQGVNCSVRRV